MENGQVSNVYCFFMYFDNSVLDFKVFPRNIIDNLKQISKVEFKLITIVLPQSTKT